MSSSPASTIFPSNPSRPTTGPPMTSLSVPYRVNSPARPSPWDSIDLDTVEIVDLTDPSSQTSGTRRRAPSPTDQQPPSKKAKGKQPETYITLDNDDDEQSGDDDESGGPEPVTPPRLHSPSQSGALSDVKCVICLDSPTDLASTLCGTSPLEAFWVIWTDTDGGRTCILRLLYSECVKGRDAGPARAHWDYVYRSLSDMSKKSEYKKSDTSRD